jgi:hypothetical protein
VMAGGVRLCGRLPPLSGIAAKTRDNIARLHPRIRALESAEPPFTPLVSPRLSDMSAPRGTASPQLRGSQADQAPRAQRLRLAASQSIRRNWFRHSHRAQERDGTHVRPTEGFQGSRNPLRSLCHKLARAISLASRSGNHKAVNVPTQSVQ